MPRTAKLKPVVSTRSVNEPTRAMRDPLDMTVRDLLLAVIDCNQVDDWINIRGNNYPWRHIVRAADRGECKISRVGRKLMMRRDELDRWMTKQSIAPRKRTKGDASSRTPADDSDDAQAQRCLERQGFRF